MIFKKEAIKTRRELAAAMAAAEEQQVGQLVDVHKGRDAQGREYYSPVGAVLEFYRKQGLNEKELYSRITEAFTQMKFSFGGFMEFAKINMETLNNNKIKHIENTQIVIDIELSSLLEGPSNRASREKYKDLMAQKRVISSRKNNPLDEEYIRRICLWTVSEDDVYLDIETIGNAFHFGFTDLKNIIEASIDTM